MFASLQQIKGEKMKRIILGCVIGVSCCVPAVANTAHADSLQGELDALRKRYHERDAEYVEIRKRYEQQGDVEKLSQAYDKSREAVTIHERSDAQIKSARAAYNAAVNTFDRRVEERLARHRDGSVIIKRIEYLKVQHLDLEFAKAVAHFHIHNRYSPVSRAMDKDQHLKRAYEFASKAQGEQRQAAWDSYNKAREYRINNLPAAKHHLQAIANATKSIKANLEAQRETTARLQKLRAEHHNVMDRSYVDRAQKAFNEAFHSEKINELRNASGEARSAYTRRLDELLTADDEATSLRERMSAINGQIHELRRKQRVMAKK